MYEKTVMLMDKFEDEKKYWLKHLHGELNISKIPTDFSDRESRELETREYCQRLDTELVTDMLHKSRNNDLSLFVLLVCVFKVLIWKYTGHSEVLTAIPVYSDEDFFYNDFIITRDFVNMDMSFKDLLMEVRDTVSEGYKNQHYPLFKVLEMKGFDVNELTHLFIHSENIHRKEVLDSVINSGFNELSLCFNRNNNELNCKIIYRKTLFKKNTIERMFKTYQRILKWALENIQRRLDDVNLLGEEEKQKILYDFNNSKAEYPETKTLHECFQEQAEKNPDHTALLFENDSLNYRELNEKANQCAQILKNKGIKPGEVVGIMINNSLEMIIGILGILKAGGAYLPINPDSPPERVSRMLKDCHISILLTQTDINNRPGFLNYSDQKPDDQNIHVTSQRPQIKDLDGLPFPDRSLVNYEQYMQYSGGADVNHCISLLATRGCPYHCVYCSKVWPKSHVVRSAEDIFEEVKILYDTGVRRFGILDDIFNLDMKNSARFFELVIKNKLNVQIFFPSGVRGDLLTKDYIDLMVEAGVTGIWLALETASPRLQKLLRKNLNIETLYKNVAYFCDKYPQVILGLFTMHGLVTETEEEAFMTLEFIKSHKWIHFPLINILKIFPNTDIYQLALENNISKESIESSLQLNFHELPHTLPFKKSFTFKYQSDFFNEYFLKKERLLHVLPYQMKVLTEEDLVRMYRSYFPGKIKNKTDLFQFLGIKQEELGIQSCMDEKTVVVPEFNRKIKAYYPEKIAEKNALKILLIDLSQPFCEEKDIFQEHQEAPLGLLYLLSYLNKQLGSKIRGKIAKSRMDFQSYDGLRNLLTEFQPGLIGIRALSSSKTFVHEAVACIRHWGLDIPIVIGGPYASSESFSILSDQNIDLVVKGEGELTFCELVSGILENNGKLPDDECLKEIPGIVFIPGRKDKQKKGDYEVILLDKINTSLIREDQEKQTTTSHSRDVSQVIFTSGTTGYPKGVLLQHNGVMNYIHWRIKTYRYTERDVTLQLLSYDFDAALSNLYSSLLSGGTLVMVPNDKRIDIDYINQLIREKGVTNLTVVPMIYEHLIDRADPVSLKTLRFVVLGGEKSTSNILSKSREKLPHVTLINEYGPTEATVTSSAFVGIEPTRTRDIGIPVDNKRIYILDNTMKPVPLGIPGEICIAGMGISRGYLNNPEFTSKVFVAHPYQEESRLYKTGDIGHWLENGHIKFLGRRDSQVKIRGYRIELEEIETRLLNMKEIKEASVIDRQDPNGVTFLCAYIVWWETSPGTFDQERIREYLFNCLPEYMIPAWFIQLEKIPRLSNGKADKKSLPEPGVDRGDEYTAPKNEIEKKLVDVWSSVLGVERIGTTENFFSLGGDSIKTIQIQSRMKQYGYRLEVNDLFDYPTINQIARVVRKIEGNTPQEVITGEILLTPIQREFFENGVDNHHFNQAVMLYSRDRLDDEIIKKVFKRIQEHHDALRITVEKKEKGMVLVNQCLDYPLSLESVDLTGVKEFEKELLERTNILQPSINLKEGPVMKIGLFRGEDGDRLLIVIHHLVVDGISWRILLEDIDHLYLHFKKGKMESLPPKSDSFKAWTLELHKYSSSEKLKREIEYWRKIEKCSFDKITRDFDHERIMEGNTSISFSLSEPQTKELLTQSHIPYNTDINDILITALVLGVKDTFGIKKIPITIESHGRVNIFEHINISRTIGWFTTTHPIIIDMTAIDDISSQIKVAKEAMHQVPEKGLGYGILKYLTPEEYLDGLEFLLQPQIEFNYLGQFDQDIEGMTYFQLARESTGDSVSLKRKASHDISVIGLIRDKKLTISISFSSKQYGSHTMERLLKNVEQELEKVISHCINKKTKEWTPSDFSYKDLSMSEMNELVKKYDLEDVCMLSPMQEGMLFHAFEDASLSYFQQGSFQLKGNMDPDIVERTLKQLSKRHDVLRTIFLFDNYRRPLQVITRNRSIGFNYIDISQKKGDKKRDFVNRYIEKDRNTPFSLEDHVLMRFTLIKLSEDEFEMIWTFYHALMDGWCIGIILKEFIEIYSCILQDRPCLLSPSTSYRAYIRWLEKRDKETSRLYWEKYLQTFKEPTTIPSIRDNNRVENDYKNASLSISIDKDKTDRLKDIARINQVTMNIIVQTIWGIILGKYNDSQDVVFGTVVSVRSSDIQGVETAVGLFINTIPVRITFDEDTRFSQLIHQVQEETINGSPHHYYSMTDIFSETPHRYNLYDHLFGFVNYPEIDEMEKWIESKELNFHGFNMKLLNMETFEQSNYDFNVVVNGGEQLSVTWKYNANVFDKKLLERISQHFQEVVQQVTENEHTQIQDIKLEYHLLDVDIKLDANEYENFSF